MHNESIHGGRYTYTIGTFTPKIDNCILYERGYHLTDNPSNWVNQPVRIYKARGKKLICSESDTYLYDSVELYEEVHNAYLYYYMYLCGMKYKQRTIELKIHKAYGYTLQELASYDLRRCRLRVKS